MARIKYYSDLKYTKKHDKFLTLLEKSISQDEIILLVKEIESKKELNDKEKESLKWYASFRSWEITDEK